MRTSCIVGESKVMVHHNGELTWGLERTLGVMIHKVEWISSKEFFITLGDGTRFQVLIKREYLR